MKDWASTNEVPWIEKRNEIKTVVIDSGIVNIGNYAFYGTRIQNMELPEGITTIGKLAFAKCHSLGIITIPKTTSIIDIGAFWDCNNLEAINVNQENRNYKSEDGILFNGEGTELILYPRKVTLEKYTIPNHVITIKQRAFEGNNYLEDINLENNTLTTIESRAFSNCLGLKSMIIPRSVTTIAENSFDGSSIEMFEIKNETLAIKTKWFEGLEKLKAIKIPEENNSYSTRGGVLYNKDKTTLIKFPSNSDVETFYIPETVTRNRNKCICKCEKY